MAVSLTVTVGGYDYGFDFEDQRIDIDATLSTISVEDLYDAIKSAQEDVVGVVYPTIALAEGKTSLGSGSYTYLTVILQGDWKFNSLKTSGFVIITGGNCVRSDGGMIVKENPLITYFNQTSQAGVLVESGTSGLTPTESATLSAIQSTMLTLSRWKSLFFKRTNTVSGGKVTQYVAGDVSEEQVTVAVAYDGDDIPTSETPS